MRRCRAVLEFYTSASDQPLRSLKRIARELRSKSDDKSVLSTAVGLLREIPQLETNGYQVDVRCYNFVVEFLVSHHQRKLASELLQTMDAKRVERDQVTHELAVKLHGERGDAAALAQYVDRNQVTLNAQGYASLLRTASFADRLLILQRMKAARVQPSMIHYNLALRRATDREKARAVGKMIAGDRLQPDSKSYNALISACGTNTQRGLELFEKMAEKAVLPTTATYCALANIHKANGSFAGVRGVMDAMAAARIAADHVAFGTMLKAVQLATDVADDRKLGLAEALFAQAEAQGQRSQILYARMMEIYSLHGSLEQGDDLLRKLKAAGLRMHPAIKEQYENLKRRHKNTR
ncbi:hypothetical protein DIPPA_16636 [Diplonema papillatum]|nr:hypothetical protein DIPPA_16636 [Diplonema papillatum]